MNKLNLNIDKYILLVFLSACQANEPVKTAANLIPLEKVEKSRMEQPSMDSTIQTDFLLGKFDPSKDDRFVLIDAIHSDRNDRLMHKEAYAAFLQMQAAAKQAGIQFKILSATRNFNYQKGIWERKWSGATKVGNADLSKTIADPRTRALKILEYSSMPGTSRHHWGTDIDLNSFDNRYFEAGQGKKEYDWLLNNAQKFGFCQPYTSKSTSGRTGYHEEKWHWSYTPLAAKFTEQAGFRITEDMITGFLGSEQAKEIGVVKKYILGINPDCLKIN